MYRLKKGKSRDRHKTCVEACVDGTYILNIIIDSNLTQQFLILKIAELDCCQL
jgi:hypothetical protein